MITRLQHLLYCLCPTRFSVRDICTQSSTALFHQIMPFSSFWTRNWWFWNILACFTKEGLLRWLKWLQSHTTKDIWQCFEEARQKLVDCSNCTSISLVNEYKLRFTIVGIENDCKLGFTIVGTLIKCVPGAIVTFRHQPCPLAVQQV